MTTTDSNIVEDIFKTKDGYNECDHCQSVLSPAAYFVKLVETIEKYIPGHKLKERRPDLFELPLDCNSTSKTKLYLEIANEIMEKNLDKKLGGNALQKLATAKYPFNLPANFPLVSIRAYLEKQGITLADLYKVLKPEADNIAESLGLLPEEYDLVTSISSNLSEVYGTNESELKNVEKFIAHANIDLNKLEQLIECYNKVKNPTGKVSVNSENINNLDNQALGFLHRFIRLANKLNWSFAELCNVLLAIDKNEIDANSLKEISRIKSLQAKLKKPISEICKLYTNASISIEKNTNKKDANNAAESLFFLQGVKESDLKKIYGIEEPSEPFKEENFDEFIARTGARHQEVEWLLSQSATHTKKKKKQEARSEISVKEQKFLHHFTQLVAQFKLLFSNLNELIKTLPNEFKLKDLVINVDDSVILQKIWNISKEELTSLINYNDKISSKTGKSLILEVHKQILLARLMNISIAEIVQILLQLNITDLNLNNVERIIELNNWLNSKSITIEQLNTLVNSSAFSSQYIGQISKIREELEKDQELKHDEKAFYNVILQHIGEQLRSANEDIITATHQFTKKHSTNLQLLRLESLNKSIVHDVGIIGNKAIFLGESKVRNKSSVEHSISEPRENVAVATIGKKTIFFGGKKSENEYSRKIDIYDEDTGSWSTDAASEARDSAAVAVVGNKAIFLGGNKDSKRCSSQVDTYDNGKWKKHIASGARSDASVAVIGEKAIFFGGRINNTRSSAIDIYSNGTWIVHTASEARSNASVAVVDTKVIFFGGNKGGNQPSAKVDIYDSKTEEWTTHTISEARENASVAVVDGKAIFFGGKIGQTRSNKIDVYDAKTEKWVEVHDTVSEARDMTSVAVVNKQAIFFGGDKGNEQFSSQVDIYDSIANSWTTHTVSEVCENVSVAVVGAKAIFFTRKKDNRATGQVYIYDSISKSWVVHVAVDNEIPDGLLAEITSSTRYCGKIDIYDDTAKAWKAVDVYKPGECTSISVRNNKATLVFKNAKGDTYERVYSIGLSVTYDAAIEELLNNTAVFITLKMDAEDINHITNHADAYRLRATWTEDQIKTLENYKTLQDEFPGNELTLSQYVEWLRDSYDESKVTEKIAQLANWDKKLLNQIKEINAFKKCFSKENHPLDSLLKIKSFTYMSEQSGIAGEILLELKDLHNLPASTGWNKYNGIERKLRELLSYVEGVKEHLENQKRNILAGYMLHTYPGIKNKNMRNLYAFLLIDVEMSDCSKISPLKAGLNSLQLYIHRCILGLEEGVTVNSKLTEEMWDLLDNYREWEATKKVALYPENYLNPTLRKSATAEYRELQNTLMQGNLADEEAAYAYIKYFEDFSQLINLQIVDTYFANNILHILGRTQAEPYAYYYRVADFGGDKVQNWLPWEKVNTQVSASLARVIHAFGKVFIFWLQKTEKQKQIEDVSINDSTLSVSYIFKRVDGSWSAQQKLPSEVIVSRKFESQIRKNFDLRDQNKKYQEMCENWRARDEKTKVNYSKDGEWTINQPVEGAIEYFKNKIKSLNNFIQGEAQKSKDISKEFRGKLGAHFDKQKREIIFVSLEEGFENSRFVLKKNLSIEKVDSNLSFNSIESADIEKSIGKMYEKRYKESVEDQEKEIKERIERGSQEVKKLEKNLKGLEKEKNDKVQQKESLQSKIDAIADRKSNENNLQKNAEDLKKRLDNLQQQESIQDDLTTVPIEKGKLQEAVNNLKQRLTKSKQIAKSKREEVKTQLTDLEKEIMELIDKINKLAKEKTIEILEKEKNELQRKGTIDGLTDAISKLDKKITDKKNEIKEINNKIESLNKEKTEYEINGKKHKDYKALNKVKQDEEVELAKALVSRRDADNKQDSYKDKTVVEFVSEAYREAYTKGTEVILMSEKQQALNFYGFYGIYLWEIFFHIPTLVAYLFNQEQKFAEARKWYQYIFNPLKKDCNAWQFSPFKTKCPPGNINHQCDSRELVDSLNPYKEADKEGKVSFEKYIIISYVDNLIDWGDMLFSQNSWEGINQATMLYIRAWDLLGEKPKKKGKFKIRSRNVCEVLTANREMLCKAETITPAQSSGNGQFALNPVSSDTTEYCSYFCTPENKDFIGLWDRIEDRLYKIRHCLDIKGKRLELPLFQPPIDPRQLVSAAAGGSTIRLPKIAQVPHYRFKYMITYAKSIADTVTQIGSELLSILEKKDAEALTLLYNKQEATMANLMTTIKEKAVETLKEEAKALNASLSSARDRKSHYEKLIEQDWSALEISSMATSVASTITLAAAGIARQVAAPLHAIPTIFGFSCGGFQPGSSADSIARGLEIFSSVTGALSQNLSISASYERRAQDWDLQKIMATHDVEQISHQIEANRINQANATQDFRAHKESIKQIREKEEFFRSKFTNQELYSWMKGELKSLYIKTYRLALEVARQAEWAYQYEIDNDKAFIQPGHWNSLKEGLLSGQKLKLELEQLDKEYHDINERRLEITKVVSLKQLDPIALYNLKAKGSCKFPFTEKFFDLDFPGHYARKIKDIKITVPAVVGPYENVHASLQQTSNQVVLKSDGAINAIEYLVNPSEEEQPETDLLRVNWKPNQEIAISKADQDSGLFELSFGDERYLPFEGTGAVSTWELSLPQATNRFDISTISDVIIHLDYTALNGGEVLSRQVKNLDQIKYYQGTLVANLSTLYPEEWEKFKQTKGRPAELKFKLPSEIFPIHIKNPSVDLDGENNICVIPTTPDMSRITIKVNNYSWERNSKKIVNPSLTIGSDWSMKINNADTNKIEEIMIMVPYKAMINW